MAKPRTLFDKIWDAHLIHQAEDGTSLIYIDRHLVQIGLCIDQKIENLCWQENVLEQP